MPTALVDTSVWVDVLSGRLPLPARRKDQALSTSLLALAEVASLTRQGRVDPRLLDWITEASRIEAPAPEDVVEGGLLHGRLRAEGKFTASIIDCISYASARRLAADFWTRDRDLVGQPGVIFF